MDKTKIDKAKLDLPRQELSVRGLRFVVALLVCSGFDFSVCLLGGQSSSTCITLVCEFNKQFRSIRT